MEMCSSKHDMKAQLKSCLHPLKGLSVCLSVLKPTSIRLRSIQVGVWGYIEPVQGLCTAISVSFKQRVLIMWFKKCISTVV